MSGNSPAKRPSHAQPLAAGGAAWIEDWFRPTVVAAMLTCIVVAFVELMARIVSGWQGIHYVIFVFLVSWEGIQSERLLRRRGFDHLDRLQYRAVEAVVILVLFRLVRYVPLGLQVLSVDVHRWGRDLGVFLDYAFFAGGMSILSLWLMAIVITKNLYSLEVHPSEIPPDPTSPSYDRWSSIRGQRVDRQAVLRQIVHGYFGGGVLLLILTGLARLDLPTVYQYDAPPLSGLVVNALVYFALGLGLISQAQFSVLQVSWCIRRIEVTPRLGTRWVWHAVIFLTLLLVIALVLPTGYSMGLPQAIYSLVRLIFAVFQFIGSLLAYLVVLLLSLLLSILGLQADEMIAQGSPPQPPTIQPSDPGVSSGPPLFELLKSVLFWGVFLAILGYSVYHFFRERPGLLPGFEGGLLARLFAWLRALWQGTRRWSARARKAIADRLRRRFAQGESLGPWRIVRLSRLSPGQRVRYFYLSILRRAARIGYGRHPQQTPYEYGATLMECIPEAAADMNTLTQAFVEARYSQRAMDDGESNLIKKVWRRARATLARKRRTRESIQGAEERWRELAG